MERCRFGDIDSVTRRPEPSASNSAMSPISPSSIKQVGLNRGTKTMTAERILLIEDPATECETPFLY
jgi:hypothetical protein